MHPSPDNLPDRWIVGAYRQLPAIEPSARVDRAILSAAAEACGEDSRGTRKPWWIWPMSMAAGLALTVGVFYQIANLVPRPIIVVMDPPAIEEARPAQRIGTPTEAVSEDPRITPSDAELDGATAAAATATVRVRDLAGSLTAAANRNDAVRARALLERASGELPENLPAATRAWLEAEGLVPAAAGE